MNRWLKRLRGAIGLGLTWAVGWALTGLVIGVSMNLGAPMEWFVKVFDAPLPALAIPGFFCGAAFSVVLAAVGRGRRFHDLSLTGFAAWGAAAGLLLSLVPVAAIGPATASTVLPVVIGTLTVLGAASATATLTLARMAERHTLLENPEGVSAPERRIES